MNIVRESKFRFIYGELSKRMIFMRYCLAEYHVTNLSLANLTGDQEFITANTKYFAVAISGGGGPVLVYPHDKGSYVPIISEVKALVGHKYRTVFYNYNIEEEFLILNLILLMKKD